MIMSKTSISISRSTARPSATLWKACRYNQLYLAGRQPEPIREAACWPHGRRPFFAMADSEENARRKGVGQKKIPLPPIAIDVVRRIDALFEIERSINRKSAEERLQVRRTQSRPLIETSSVGASFTLFLEDGRVCLSNNAAERGLRGIALGRKSWLFCGSDRGGQRAAAMYSLIVTAKRNGADLQAWLADVLARIAAHPAHRLNFCPGIGRQRSSPSRMTTHVNKVHHVTTITKVANDLGEDEDWLWDIANEIGIERGVIWV
ncbi:hypothetical protein ABH999_000705 [Bradyrhizobium yuanmingense]